MTSTKGPFLVLVVALLVAGSCSRVFRGPPVLQSFAVTFTDIGAAVDTGSAGAPLEFVSGRSCSTSNDCDGDERCRGGRCSRCYQVDVQAIDDRGSPIGYDGFVHLDVTPGFVVPSTEYLEVVGGQAANVEVCINRASGPTNIWVEQDGVAPRPLDVKYGQCNDGLDNDGNGPIDLNDPGCDSPFDDLEAPVSGATGLSDTLLFRNPLVHELQQTGAVQTGPMRGLAVRVDSGAGGQDEDLVVTNVVGNGFYVTDMARLGAGQPYPSVFVFTFSAPEGVLLNDAVVFFSGTVEEHVGQTQVIFPSYEVVAQSVHAQAPPAGGQDLTDLLEVEQDNFDSGPVAANSELLEAWESSLVRVGNIAVPTRLISCDRDGNGSIEPGDEANCRNACNEDFECTDLESFFEYRQWLGRVDGRKRMGFSVALAADFTPLQIDFLGQEDQQGLCEQTTTPLGFLEYTCPPRTVESISGSLRHVYLCGSSGDNDCGLQFWILDPRFDGDVVVGGS